MKYFISLTVAFHDISSLYGFCTLVVVISQIFSGTMLALSFVPESALVPAVRDEEDVDVLYVDDFFWLHERGVDFIFLFSYIHLFKKLYLNSYDTDQEAAWKSGVFVFIIFQVVTFLGLLLCSTHLSEITLTIATNIFHTLFAFFGHPYSWVFTDKTLNTDTIIRMAYLHYISAFYMSYIALLHGEDLHYDWKNSHDYEGIETEMVWWDEALANELATFIDICLLFFIACIWLYPEPDSISYELFTWGEILIDTDVRFYSVAPHWYFRPFMAWLVACPHHKTGLFGLVYFFFILYHQPTFHKNKFELSFKEKSEYRKKFEGLRFSSLVLNVGKDYLYASVFLAYLYIASYLPYGRFYSRFGGNNMTLFCYIYILSFLTFRNIRLGEVYFYYSTWLMFELNRYNKKFKYVYV